MTVTSINASNNDKAEDRSRRRSMFALFILLSVTFFAITSDGIETLLKSSEITPRGVSFGAEASYAGGRWRLKELRIVDAEDVPEGAAAVQTIFEVTIESSDLMTAWSDCGISLQDTDGRRWQPVRGDSLPIAAGAMTCGEAMMSGAHPGDKVAIADTFLVPKQAISSMRPSVSVFEERSDFLSFSVRPDQKPLETSPSWRQALRLLY
ncbi:hypothetical protein IB262_33315 [Ensifer sp. ENS02]|uniref:hypothetical protein n=1 Tax=Ensifer sp. ENS02 TaxID=2769290 RepID=UPI00177DB29F|nr:hypothetical protein [Ensifer sp. ENS02]MBD9524757.1 hypothetical protein [Ensifer sp. ENS02]